MARITLLNRGERTFHLKPIVEKGAEGQEVITKRLFKPGQSMEFDDAEAKMLSGYPDVVDASKIVAGIGDKIAALESENAALKKERAELKEQLSKMTLPETEIETKDDGKKGNKAQKR